MSEEPPVKDDRLHRLATIRSHDRYDTAIYGLDGRYRGLVGGGGGVHERKAADERERCVSRFKARPYGILRGSTAACHSETNPLLPLTRRDPKSKTPPAKSIVVRPESG